jgi:hypothetical protein
VQKTRWSDAAPILVFALTIVAISLILYITGETTLLLMILSPSPPLAAFLVGILGIHVYNQQPEMKQDHFHTIYLWLGISLVILALSEIIVALFSLMPASLEIELTVSLVQLSGVLLWGFGILQYLKSVNLALEIVDNKKLWMALLIIWFLATLILVILMVLFMPGIGCIDAIIISPMVVGQCICASILLGLVWIFREGEIAKPLFLIFIGFVLFLIRTAHWGFSVGIIGTPLNSIIAFEAYMFFGMAFLLVQSLGDNAAEI